MNGTETSIVLHAGLVLISILYALILQAMKKAVPELYDHGTILTVVFGVGYVLVALSCDPAGLTVTRLWTAFTAAAAPIAVRSMFNWLVDYRSLLRYISGGKRDDGNAS